MRALALLVFPAVIAGGIAVSAVKLAGTQKPVPTVRPTATVWAGRVFVSRKGLERWLRSRGASYAAWARKHPAGETGPQRAASGHAKAAAAAPKTEPSGTSARASSRWTGTGFLAAAATLAAALAVLLTSIRTRLRLSRLALPRLPRVRPGGTLQTVKPDLSRYGAGAAAAAAGLAVATTRSARVIWSARPRRSQLETVSTRIHQSFLVLHRRRELGWYASATALAVVLGLLLPHMIG